LITARTRTKGGADAGPMARACRKSPLSDADVVYHLVMKDDEIRETLLLEIHALIEQAASEAVKKIGRGDRYSLPDPVPPGSPPLDLDAAVKRACDMGMRSLVVYPPQAGEPQLSREEHEALANLALTSACRRGMEKLVADAAASAFFGFFCLVEGVADPALAHHDLWCAVIRKPREDDKEGHRAMLHDELLGSYWRYLELRNARAKPSD